MWQVCLPFLWWVRQSATIPLTVFGGGSIQLARVFGIRVGVDTSWFFVVILIIWSLSGYYGDIFPGEDGKAFVLAVISALLFFLSVLLHEFGHALVAKRNGIGISGIDLWMFGGVAKLERDTDSPGEEFRVTAAGPLVTLLIALACFGAGAALAGADGSIDAGSFDLPSDPDGVRWSDEVLAVLGYLTFINGLLLVFNLIPAFPLDGGRLARAIAWWRTGDRTRATRFAARLGRGFAVLMVAGGIVLVLQGVLVSGIWLAMVGWFLGQAARSMEQQTVLTSRIEGLKVSDVMEARPLSVPAELTVDLALAQYFGNRHPWLPVIDDGGRLLGLVTLDSVEGLPEQLRSRRTVGSIMAADPGSMRIGAEEPVEALLAREALARLGVVMAVDSDGRLCGMVTADRLRNLLRGPAPVGR